MKTPGSTRKRVAVHSSADLDQVRVLAGARGAHVGGVGGDARDLVATVRGVVEDGAADLLVRVGAGAGVGE